MENKFNKLLLESIDRDIEIILDKQVETNFPLICAYLIFMFTKTFGHLLLPKRDWNVSMKRKTKHTNLRLPCIVMIFLGEFSETCTNEHIQSVGNVYTITKILSHLQGSWESSKQGNGLRFGDSGEMHMRRASESYRLNQKEDK